LSTEPIQETAMLEASFFKLQSRHFPCCETACSLKMALRLLTK